MKFKGTKGEWIYKKELQSHSGYRIIVSELGNIIHKSENKNGLTEEVIEANAKLIASAPDLLEALQEMQIDLTILKSNFIQIEKTDSRAEGMTDVIDKWIERNKKAIEKALL